MDPLTDNLALTLIMFFLVTLPLLFLAARLRQIGRTLQRIEAMSVRSLQRWP